MKRAAILAVLLTASCSSPSSLPDNPTVIWAAPAEEKPVTSRVASIGLFKNGLAVVRRIATVPGPGTYRLENVPEPVHGTYWVESDAKIVTRLTRRVVDVPADRSIGVDFQEELAGKEVVIHFADSGIPPAAGTVVALEPPRGTNAWNRAYEQPRYGRAFDSSSRLQNPGRTLVLETEKGRSYVDSSRIAYLQAAETGNTVRRRVPVMLFRVDEVTEKPATISISYLAKGIAWAPSYRVDIADAKTLLLTQKAVIKNELEHFENAELELISGFPSIQFANVTSPLSLNTNWTSFFQQLNQRFSGGHPSMQNVISQQIAFNAPAPGGGVDMSAIPTGEGVDLHYQDIGRHTMDEGDSMALQTAAGKASYERIVEWIVPDTRRADGRYLAEHERQSDPEKYQDAAWDAVRFRNPLEFPMTTAPATVVSGSRFNGQRLSYWVNSGEETTLHVTKALSIRTRSIEQELEGQRELTYIGGYQYRKTTVEGELRVNNHRKETIKLVIRRRFSGDLLKADGSPSSTLLEEGAWSVNKRNQLTWSLALEPGEETKLTYRYTVLVRH
jgi:hypothetical protein